MKGNKPLTTSVMDSEREKRGRRELRVQNKSQTHSTPHTKQVRENVTELVGDTQT